MSLLTTEELKTLATTVIGLVIGSAITTVVKVVRGKTAVLRYTSRVEHVALSPEDPVLGSVKVTWRDREVPNLYSATVEVDNCTMKDFRNLTLRVFADEGTTLLTEKTAIPGSTYAIDWTPEYKDAMSVPDGETLSAQQWERLWNSRDYFIPVFNRGQKLKFTYLCTKQCGNEQPWVFVDTQFAGLRLKYEPTPSLIIAGIPANVALYVGLFLSLLIVAVCGLFITNPWAVAVICTTSGMAVQVIGAGVCAAWRRVRHWLAA